MSKKPITIEVDGEVSVLDELPEEKAFALECYLSSLLNGLRVNWDAYEEEIKEHTKLKEESFHRIEGLLVDLCNLLDLDYCIAKDEDIFNAIRRLKGTATDEQQELYCSM